MPRIKDRTVPTSVWTTYGHRFMSDGNGADEWGYWRSSCLTCGATYQLRAIPGDWTRGEYMAANGDEPMPCPGLDSAGHAVYVIHGIERHCDRCESAKDEPCAHELADCNCLACA